MSAAEIIDRLTGLVKLQADIIREQAAALEQVRAAVELDGRIEEAERERREIIKEN